MDYEVIVVGGGIGGLTTAALLAARGVRVCLFERQSRVGGCVSRFEHQGFSFEPTHGLYSGWQQGAIWQEIFSRLPVAPPSISKLMPSYVVRLPGGRDVQVSDDAQKFESTLTAAFPDCANAASGFFRELDQIASASTRDDEVAANLLAATSPDFRLFIDVQLQTLAQRSSTECSAIEAAAVLSTARRQFWAIDGGGQALADRLAGSFKESGGKLRVDSPVLRLAYAANGDAIGVDLLTGERVQASRAIISNLTVWDTYGKLIGLSRTPRSISAELRNTTAWGAYLMFLGMDSAAQERLPASRLILATDSTDGAFAADRQQLMVNVTSVGPAPEGKVAVTVSAFTQAEDWFSFHEDESSHEAQDQSTLEACWSRLHKAMPELGDSVDVIETATPRTYYDATRRKFGMVGTPRSLFRDFFGEATSLPNVFIVSDTTAKGSGLENLAHASLSLADGLTN